jgi:hypothetical protein
MASKPGRHLCALPVQRICSLDDPVTELAVATVARFGLGMFTAGAFAAIIGWLPVLVFAGTDAAIVVAVLGVVALLSGATLWFFNVP